MNKFEEAREDFKKVKDLKSMADYQIAESYENEGKYTEAVKEFEKTADEFEQIEDDVSLMAQFRAGYGYFYGLNDPFKAQESFYKIGRYGKTNIDGYYKEYIEPRVDSEIDRRYTAEEKEEIKKEQKGKVITQKKKRTWKTQEEIDKEEEAGNTSGTKITDTTKQNSTFSTPTPSGGTIRTGNSGGSSQPSRSGSSGGSDGTTIRQQENPVSK